VGVDVSPASVTLCRQRFANDPGKRFLLAGTDDPGTADLVLSLDVIFHLVEDDVFHEHMATLFARARRLVAIYASDRDAMTADAHVRHRSVSFWIFRHAPEWDRVMHIPNPYPYDRACPEDTSFADFHIYARRPVAAAPLAAEATAIAERNAAGPPARVLSRGDRRFRVADHPFCRDGVNAFSRRCRDRHAGFL
jgi:hypothetical protein